MGKRRRNKTTGGKKNSNRQAANAKSSSSAPSSAPATVAAEEFPDGGGGGSGPGSTHPVEESRPLRPSSSTLPQTEEDSTTPTRMAPSTDEATVERADPAAERAGEAELIMMAADNDGVDAETDRHPTAPPPPSSSEPRNELDGTPPQPSVDSPGEASIEGERSDSAAAAAVGENDADGTEKAREADAFAPRPSDPIKANSAAETAAAVQGDGDCDGEEGDTEASPLAMSDSATESLVGAHLDTSVDSGAGFEAKSSANSDPEGAASSDNASENSVQVSPVGTECDDGKGAPTPSPRTPSHETPSDASAVDGLDLKDEAKPSPKETTNIGDVSALNPRNNKAQCTGEPLAAEEAATKVEADAKGASETCEPEKSSPQAKLDATITPETTPPAAATTDTAEEVTVTFTDYVDLQTRLILLPLDDEECLGAKVASYEPPPEAASDGDGDIGDEDHPASRVVSPCSTLDDGDMDEVALDGEEEKKDGEPSAAIAPPADGSKISEEVGTAAFPPSVEIVGFVLCGVGGADEEGEWTDNEFSFILGSIREARAPIVLRFCPPEKVPGFTPPVEAADDAGVAEEEGPSPATASETLNRVLSPEAAAAAQAKASALKGRLSSWGSRLRTSANAAAAEASTRAGVLAERAEARAREAMAERAEARRVEERLAEARERSELDDGAAGDALFDEADAREEAEKAAPEGVESETEVVAPDADGDEASPGQHSRGEEPVPPASSPSEESEEDAPAAEGTASSMGAERNMSRVTGPIAVGAASSSDGGASRGPDAATAAPAKKKNAGAESWPENCAAAVVRDDKAASSEPVPAPATARIGKPPMPPKSSPSKQSKESKQAKDVASFLKGRGEIEVPSLLDAAGDEEEDDDDDEVPCGIYLQKADGSFAPLEFDETHTQQQYAAPTSQSADFPFPPGMMVRSSSFSSVASGTSGGSYGSSAVFSSGSGPPDRKRRANPYHKSSRHPVTNSSVLIVRTAADASCPARGYSYQWYRSYRGGDAGSGVRARRRRAAYSSDDDSSLASSSVGSGGCGGAGAGGNGGLGGDVAGWSPLKGATYAAFQPSATDVGHRVRCIVTIEPSAGEGRRRSRTVICELLYPVTSDPGLFNAARKRFFEGGSPAAGCAVFGGLDGRGNAEGRTFRLEISMGFNRGTTRAAGVSSRVVVCQVSGRTAEPMHDRRDPILGASAVADASQPKAFELTFPGAALPPSACMIDALCSDAGRFALRAPSRVARESLLLALGIANFGGHPTELDTRTTLFPGPPPCAAVPPHAEEVVSVGAEDSAHSVHSSIDGDTTDEESKVAEVAPAEEVEKQRRQQQQLYHIKTPEKPAVQTDEQFEALEGELKVMLEKLFSKEKVVSDLQRRLAQSESERQRTRNELYACRTESRTSQDRYRDCQTSLGLAEETIESNESVIARMQGDHSARVSSLEKTIRRHEASIAEHQKTTKSLENEKAVLSAAVEARDGKLVRMSQLQSTVDSLRREVAKGAAVQKELNDTTAKFNATKVELGRASVAEKECQQELMRAKRTLQQVSNSIKQEQKLAVACKSQMECIHMKYQKVKAERNSFKLKADSLSKEMSRICRNGVGIADIEKMMSEHESTKKEVTLLKSQKRSALEELEATRQAHDQYLQAQKQAGVDGEAVRALEQKAELERVVSDLTEYINAKEMQLGTLKEVNKTLTEELHMMAQANLGENDI